jgi:hypothetical protein
LRFIARDLIRANFGGIKFLFEHTVGWCSASAPASQLLMSSPRLWRVSRRPSNCAKRLGLRQSSGALWRKRNPAGFLHELDCANINMIRDNRPFDGGGAVLSSSSLGGPFFPEAMVGKGENFHFTCSTSIADSRPTAKPKASTGEAPSRCRQRGLSVVQFIQRPLPMGNRI